MAHLDFGKLAEQITRLEGEVPSAVALMTAFFDEVESHKGEPEALQQLVDRGRTQIDALAAAIVARTTPPDA